MLQRLAMSVDEAQKVTGVCRTTLYSAMRDGSLPSLKVGRKRLLLWDDVRQWLEQHRAPLEPLPHGKQLEAARQRRRTLCGDGQQEVVSLEPHRGGRAERTRAGGRAGD